MDTNVCFEFCVHTFPPASSKDTLRKNPPDKDNKKVWSKANQDAA